MEKEKFHEQEFLYNFFINDDDFKKTYKEYNKNKNLSFHDTIIELICYILYSEFNPYLEEKYLDITWLEDKEKNILYNLDDIMEVYIDNLKEE